MIFGNFNKEWSHKMLVKFNLKSFFYIILYNNTLFHIYTQRKNYKNCRKLEKKGSKITIEIIFTLIRLIHEKSVTLLFIYFFNIT